MMKYFLLVILFFTSFFISLGQTPTQPPAPDKTKTFGSSLEKYKNKEKKESQPNSKSIDSNSDEIIQVKTDLVINDILVTDKTGKVIEGLNKDDFILIEDDIQQTIEMFSFGDNISSPRSIVLIIDVGIGQLPYLKKSIQSAKILVDKLKPSDKMAIVSGNQNLLVDFIEDKTKLKEILDSLESKNFKFWGGEWEFTNLLTVLNEMFSEKDTHRIIIFQGTGNEIVVIKSDDETVYQWYKSAQERFGFKLNWKRNLEFRDVIEGVEESRTTIYSVIPGIRVLGLSKKEQLIRARKSLDDFRDSGYYKGGDYFEEFKTRFQDLEAKRLDLAQKSMFNVAKLSGGYTSFLEKPEDAEGIYSNIFNEFSNRYSIGYYPTNQEQNGKRRVVKIKVQNHPEYTILYRENYLPR